MVYFGERGFENGWGYTRVVASHRIIHGERGFENGWSYTNLLLDKQSVKGERGFGNGGGYIKKDKLDFSDKIWFE